MKRILIITMALLMGMSVALAQTNEADQLSFCEQILETVAIEQGMELPSFLSSYKNERFLVYQLDGDPVGHIIIEDNVIQSANCTLIEDQTFSVHLDSVQTIVQIQESQRPLREFNAALSQGRIQVEGESLRKNVKRTVTRWAIRIGSWFS
ncbi:MAG: hypothetical protein ACMXYF_04820 [Candidatus Woesearchaeota archaeon]